MSSPCDKAAIRSAEVEVVPCTAHARRWVLVATILASSMAFIDSTVANVALPAIQTGFGVTVVDVQWVVEAYGLFLSALILVGGSLGDLFGRRLVFLIGVTIFALASAGCAAAANIQQLIIARILQGIGAALLVPGSLAIISTTFDERSRGRAIGTWSGFTAITTATGPVVGGWLIEHASWRWAFLINVPLAAAVIVISLWHIPESRTSAARVDWAGVLLVSLGLCGLVYGCVESGSVGWSNPLIWGSVMGGIGLLLAFVFVERRVRSPMVPPTIFKSREFTGANLLTLFLYSALGVFFFLFPLNLIQVQGYSATATGAAMLPFVLFMFALSRWSGGLVASYGARRPLIAGPLIAVLGFLLFTIPSAAASYWASFFPAIIVLGFGMAVTVAPLTTVVMSSGGQQQVGVASGINNAVARVAGVLAIAVLGIVMVSAFSARMNRHLAQLSLPATAVHQIQADEIKLAGLQAPESLDDSVRMLIGEKVKESFVFGFRTIMLICAALSLAGSAVAWRLIKPG